MSFFRSSLIRRVCLIAWLLPAFIVAQADGFHASALGCGGSAETVGSACCDGCEDEAPGRECPVGCDTCPCCPGVAPGMRPRSILMAAVRLSGPILVEAAGEPVSVETARLFRPPRAVVAC